MKNGLFVIAVSSILTLLCAGCAHEKGTSTGHRRMEVGSTQGPRGFVEFSAATNKAIIPISRLDNDGRHFISAVGLTAGERYDFDRTPMVVAERLTIAAPTGKPRFMVETEGPTIEVPVNEGKTTGVVIDYTLLDQGETFVIYRADAHVLEPVEAKSGK